VVGNTQRKYADELRVTGFEIKSALENFMNHHTELGKQCPACAANTMLGSLSDDVGNLNVRYWSLFLVCVRIKQNRTVVTTSLEPRELSFPQQKLSGIYHGISSSRRNILF
jgi:hypothetical protein